MRIHSAIFEFRIIYLPQQVRFKSFSAKMSYPIVGPESIMISKSHGTTTKPVMEGLKWNVDRKKADQICCYNRDNFEEFGYWLKTSFMDDVPNIVQCDRNPDWTMTFYDSVSGKPLFIAPQGRSWNAFITESQHHGWPSFRDEEV